MSEVIVRNGYWKLIVGIVLVPLLGWALSEVRSSDLGKIEAVNEKVDMITQEHDRMSRIDSMLAAMLIEKSADIEENRRLNRQNSNLLLLLAEELEVPQSKIEAAKVAADTVESDEEDE